jgi:hypothetical protein
VIAIAAASFKEALRKKLFILVAALTLIYLTLFGVITHFAVKDLAREGALNSVNALDVASNIISFLGFYFSSMLVAFLTIKRSSYVLGKYLGLGLLSVSYGIFLFSAIMIICTIFKLPIVKTLEPLNVIKGLLFFTLEPIAILSLSIFGSTAFKTLSNGIFIISIYILGLIGGVMEQIGSMLANQSLTNLGIISSLISPFDIIYRQMLSSIFGSLGITSPFVVTSGMTSTAPSIWMLIYIFVYIPSLVLMAIRKFRLKDIS